MVMKRVWIGVFAAGMMFGAVAAQGAGLQDKKESDKKKESDAKKDEEKVVVKGSAVTPEAELPGDSTTEGSVTVGRQAIA